MDKELQAIGRRLDEIDGVLAALTAVIATMPNANSEAVKSAQGLLTSLTHSPTDYGSSPLQHAIRHLGKIASLVESISVVREAGE